MFLVRLALVLLTAGCPLLAAPRPNIIVILSDDLGWGSVGCYGADPALVSTPHIDRLAREGRRFTDANTTSSVCSPTRYSVMTGRYCWRTSLISEVLSTTAPLHIETTRLTVASMLKSQGYSCAAVGKWHLGYGTAERCDFTRELKPGPLEIGFDYHFGVPSNHGDIAGVYVENHWVLGLNKQSPSSPSPPYITMGQQKGKAVKTMDLNAPKRVDEDVMGTITDKVVNWISKQNADKPFFVYYTPVAVHNPITPSKQTAGKSKGGPFCDFISDLDLSVGRILDVLDQKGLAGNTLVLFSSDNGGVNKPENANLVQTDAQKAGLKPVGPFRGGKHDVWEGGFRVPYLIRWPGRVPAGTVCDETISLVDTLASLAGITEHPLPKADAAAEDSHDISPAWLGKKHPSPIRPDVIVHSADGNFAIRKGSLKWIEGVPAEDIKPAAKKIHAAQFKPQLYDLGADIAEAREISAQNPDAARELQILLNRYRDGGYSREVPPANVKPKPAFAALPPIKNAEPVDMTTYRGNGWTSRDNAWFGKAGDKGAALTGPFKMHQGVLEFQTRLGEADRLSLRLHTAGNAHSYRVVLSRAFIEVAKNPDKGQTAEATLPLAKTRVKFKSGDWQTLRLTFRKDELTVEFAGTTTHARHAVMTEAVEQANFISFEGEVGIRNVIRGGQP